MHAERDAGTMSRMRLLVLVVVVAILAGLYFVVDWRHEGRRNGAVLAAGRSTPASVSLADAADPRVAIEAIGKRVETLAAEIQQLRTDVGRSPTQHAAEPHASALDEDEFRRAYRDVIVRIMAEENARPSSSNARMELLRGSVARYLISQRLDTDEHASDWRRITESALARLDEMKFSTPSTKPSGSPSSSHGADERTRARAALRAQTYAELAATLDARHVDVLLDMVFNF